MRERTWRAPKITHVWLVGQTLALMVLVFVPLSPDRTRLVPAPVDGLQDVAAAQVVAVDSTRGGVELRLAGMDSRTPPEPSLALVGVGTVAESGERRILGPQPGELRRRISDAGPRPHRRPAGGPLPRPITASASRTAMSCPSSAAPRWRQPPAA